MMIDTYITRGCLNKPVVNTEENSFRCICPGCNKLNVYNWLDKISDDDLLGDPMVEVRFKNTRKGYYLNVTGIPLTEGDIVAVEASPGHDIGIVSLRGALVPIQMKRNNIPTDNMKKVYRKAKPNDVDKWSQAIEKEQSTMIVARQIVAELKLDMKISDVEFQGDNTKATFYYISNDRVDFRQLIKEFADNFKVRIEMKQIGARQEAGKVGGIGTCGRELCCSSWMTSFASVSTSAARYQEMLLNPQKLAGQCGKLKCCLNYELKCYIDAQSDFPDTSIPLETDQGKAYHTKTDVYRRLLWYSFEKDKEEAQTVPLDVDVVNEIIRLNRQGIIVKALETTGGILKEPVISYQNAVGEDSINRFEEKRRKKKKKNAKPSAADNKPSTADNKPPVSDKKPPVTDNKPPVADNKPPIADHKAASSKKKQNKS